MRTGEEEPEQQVEEVTPEAKFSRFPSRGGQPRRVFFDELSTEDAALLASRGYEPTVLMVMPRDTARDHQDFLFGLLQGMTDGTIAYDKQRIDAAELELRARHMLNRESTLSRASNRDDSDLADVWNWERGTNTLQGNTTFTSPSEIQAFVKQQREAKYGAGGKPAGVEKISRKLRRNDKNRANKTGG